MHATVNGIDVAYTEEGKVPGLLLAHGFPKNRGTWAKRVEAFRASHRVIAPDPRGLGEAEATAKVIPGAQPNLFAPAGHLVAFEAPNAFSEWLSAWLTRS